MKKIFFTVGDSKVKKVLVGKKKLVFIGGPCAIENLDHSLFMAEKIFKITSKLKIQFIFKSSYNKDCRSSAQSFSGVGLDKGLDILDKVRSKIGVPVTSDFSVPEWGKATGQVCDLVQIPAYLCRQSSILEAAAKTNKPINLKKGQYMSPWNMKNSIRKIEHYGNKKIILTERGTFMGYNMLVNDFKSLEIMAETGYPVCYDATHSIQMPTSMGSISGGQREYIPMLVRSSMAAGADCLFMEIHDNPSKALSDPNTVLNLRYLENILEQAKIFHEKFIKLDSKIKKLKII
jgi:2-dehydro-3-deoxyphosphooctonate aldolase (KDO 8-P synthase)